jgi:hypothetical protein
LQYNSADKLRLAAKCVTLTRFAVFHGVSGETKSHEKLQGAFGAIAHGAFGATAICASMGRILTAQFLR